MADYSKYIWHNSKIIPWENAKVHVMSHVIHYGSGVFEGIKCYKTEKGPQIFRLEDHVNRLFKSAESYKMNIPLSKQSIIDGCMEIVRANNLIEKFKQGEIFEDDFKAAIEGLSNKYRQNKTNNVVSEVIKVLLNI